MPTNFCEVKIKVALQERTYPLCSNRLANSVKYNCLQFTLVYYNRPIYDAKRMEHAICRPTPTSQQHSDDNARGLSGCDS